jgi:pimeloyl-ACP methyl ester carboxylesterase
MSPLRKAALSGAAFFLCGFLSACGTQPWLSPQERAEHIAHAGNFERQLVVAPPFVLTTYQRRATGNSDILTVYIEGDGAPWDSATRPPHDPTPLNPVSLRLASRDRRAPLLYIARPCQYLNATELAACDVRYWTRARFSREVVAAINHAINQTRNALGSQQVRLIGFSGGGVLAALVAAMRHDVDSLVTLAAPLDVTGWAAYHEISPLRESLDPMDFKPAWSRLHQAHLVGARDAVVPPAYLSTLQGKMPFATLRVVPGYTHDCCWEETWPDTLPKEFQ